jgi:hypothetical protein
MPHFLVDLNWETGRSLPTSNCGVIVAAKRGGVDGRPVETVLATASFDSLFLACGPAGPPQTAQPLVHSGIRIVLTNGLSTLSINASCLI